jgi:YidC/Oxa1 family membrane protein insertase
MNILVQSFNTLLYQPLFNILILLYQYLPGNDFGIAVIVLTALIRLILYPLTAQSIKSQKALSQVQPKIQEIQKKFKNSQEKQVKEMLELYKKEKISPLSGFLPLLIQLPIIIALFRLFQKGLQPEEMAILYSFVPHLGPIDPSFLGMINLSQASLVLAVLAGIFQFFQSKMLAPVQQKPKKEGQISQFSKMFQKQITYFLPFFTVLILLRLPAALGLYWITTSLFSIGQQYILKNNAQSQ